ncbi:MAG: VWA domain-containing protein [Firmicutes bacterium]|nr:VWA domain-containing protein [Bacillota bacterium]
MDNNDFVNETGAVEVSKRILRLYWLVDVSASMSGKKIGEVNYAITEVIPDLQDEAAKNYTVQMNVRAMKFGKGAAWHTSETKIENFEWTYVDADAPRTDTGAALALMAEELTEENLGAGRGLPPVIILMSDGEATDDYESGIQKLLAQKWGRKAIRIAIAIGADADTEQLLKFCSNPKECPPIEATNARKLVDSITWASVAVSQSVSQAKVGNSEDNIIPLPPMPQETIALGAETTEDEDDDVF